MARRIVIPARMGSTRLPGKMLLNIAGKPMLQHTYEHASQCDVDSIVIAVDKSLAGGEINWGAEVCVTDSSHQTGTDRTAEAVTKLNYADDDFIVIIQGDEPMIPIDNVHRVFDNLERHTKASVATLADKLDSLTDVLSPHAVKVVTDKNNYALYFSRAAIPWGHHALPSRLPQNTDYRLHIGIYGYRCAFLKHYAALTPAPIEQTEALEQLRILWHGYKVHVDQAPVNNPPGVDTEAGLTRVRKLFNHKLEK